MPNPAADKNKLRSVFLTIRRSMTLEEYNIGSEKITHQLFEQLQFKNADTVHTYVSLKNRREVATERIIEKAIELQKRVIVPKMGLNGQLSHHQIFGLDDLEPNKWGVFEPIADRPVKLSDISLIIVPMVGADFQRNRIGYGKGYYDRFLLNSNTFSIGLCFNCTLSWSNLPVEPFDQKPNQIITENKVI